MDKRSAILDTKNEWNHQIMWWVLGSIFAPITFPYILFQVLSKIRAKMCRQALPGKVVLITGASSGLGEALAHVFYNAGCRLVLVARRKEQLERVRRDLMEMHSTVVTHPPVVKVLDLSEVKTIQHSVNEIIAIHGHVDILINNGGISSRSDVMSTSLDVDVRVMAVNYFGAVAMTKAVLPSMVKQRDGIIINVSSIQGKIAIPFRASYSASKHALQAFSDSLRAELHQYNINVLTVSPGYIKTSLSINAVTGNGEAHGQMDSTTEHGANPEDVAKQILKSVLRGDKDVVLAPLVPKIGIFIRKVCPPLYFYLMSKRAKSQQPA